MYVDLNVAHSFRKLKIPKTKVAQYFKDTFQQNASRVFSGVQPLYPS